jgi:hypothetical protein
MAKKKTRRLPELPAHLLERCVHCGHDLPAPCSPRAWRKAESCPFYKQFEADFYRRNAGGPVAMTSLTRGRGYFGSFEPAAHVQSYEVYHRAQDFDRKLAERRRTEHRDHIEAYGVIQSREWLMNRQHQPEHGEHCIAYFYHLHPQHKPAWMLNPFLLDP